MRKTRNIVPPIPAKTLFHNIVLFNTTSNELYIIHILIILRDIADNVSVILFLSLLIYSVDLLLLVFSLFYIACKLVNMNNKEFLNYQQIPYLLYIISI